MTVNTVSDHDGTLVCKNSALMASSAALWIALAVALAGLAYLWIRCRALRAVLTRASADLEQRTDELAVARQTLSNLAGLDGLTSLANHSRFQKFLRGEWRRALRDASSLSVLMIEIDRFREYNDQLGHDAGDECLVKIGRTLEELVRRPGDLVARYGGAEFATVMSHTDPQGAYRVAHRMCVGVDTLEIAHPRSEVSSRVTVSIGVATSTPAVDSSN